MIILLFCHTEARVVLAACVCEFVMLQLLHEYPVMCATIIIRYILIYHTPLYLYTSTPL